MKVYIDTLKISNPELIPVVVEALERDGAYEVMLDDPNRNFDLNRDRTSQKYEATLTIVKNERFES